MARRSGGRKAMLAARSKPLAKDSRPVSPGETGGGFRPLSDVDMESIAETAFKILEEVGFCQATSHCIEACTAIGAVVGEDGRLRFPRAVVEAAMNMADRNLTLYGQNPEHDVDLRGQRVHFSTAGAAVMVSDPVNNEYRDSTAKDLYDMARIVDNCEHIHMFQRTCVLRDITSAQELDLNTAYLSVSGTSKHVGTSFTEASHVSETIDMLEIVAGGEERWRARPFVSMSNCFVVPPMKFAEESLECLRVGVERGMPILLLSAGQSGATAPAQLAGAVAQAWAECLGGLVYVNAIKPGAPAIIGTWPFVCDLRTGSMSGGSPEQGLLSAACAQMGNYFDLPTGTAGGMSDAKFPDFQAGAERGYTASVAALAGANIVYESAGMYASLLGVCPESFLMDNDVLGASLRLTKGITVNEESLSYETLKEVCLSNTGHYLGSSQTLSVMQSEFLYPILSDRDSPNVWKEKGKPILLDKAVAKKEQILNTYYPKHINDEVDLLVRERYNIYVSAADMGR